MRYQWLREGQYVPTQDRYTGVNSEELRIDRVQASDAGRYQLRGNAGNGYTDTQPATLTVICAADFDDGTGSGTPDGGVNHDDLLYYLRIYGTGERAADLDGGRADGLPDGGVTTEDLLYFLSHYEQGC